MSRISFEPLWPKGSFCVYSSVRARSIGEDLRRQRAAQVTYIGNFPFSATGVLILSIKVKSWDIANERVASDRKVRTPCQLVARIPELPPTWYVTAASYHSLLPSDRPTQLRDANRRNSPKTSLILIVWKPLRQVSSMTNRLQNSSSEPSKHRVELLASSTNLEDSLS